jgi:DNA-binding CsgD family transcriptional regulator
VAASAHRSPFVGRDAELADLQGAMADARAGAGAVLLVCGPAGIGKTRLVEEALAGSPPPVPVRWGRSVDDPGAPPLWPWRRVLPDVPSELAVEPSADLEAARFRFVSAATDALLSVAGPAGLVVVLEDLHWADATSLRLLRHLAGEVRRSRLLVIGTQRGLPGPELLSTAARCLVLEPLSEPAVGDYLRAVGSDAAAREAHRRSGGNPLYLRALSRGAELQHLVRTTVAGLAPEVLDMVATAAVLGEEVDAAVLAAVAGIPPAQVTGRLDAAVRAGVLTAVPAAPGRRRFVHAVVRDGVYADLAPGRREELHRRTALVLEEQATADPATAGVVAGHWLRGATDPAGFRRAADWARRASSAATGSIAFDEAARFLQLAREAQRRAGAGLEEQAELLTELAAAEYRAGRCAAALRAAEQASDTATASGRPDLVAAAALAVHDVAAPEVAAVLVRLCERALAGPATGAVRARLLAQLASALADEGQLERAEALALEALTLAESSADPVATIDAVRARMKCAFDGLDAAERLRLGRTAVTLGTSTGQPLVALWGHKWRIEAALELGAMDHVEDELTQVAALARATGLPLVRWHSLRLDASVAALRGRFAVAQDLDDQATSVATARLAEDSSAVGMTHAFAFQRALVTGEPVRSDRGTASSLDDAPRTPIVRVTQALYLLLTGRRDEAAAAYEALRGQLTSPGFTSLVHGVPLNLVPLVEAFDDRQTAAFLLDLLQARPFVSGGAGIYCSEPSDLYLGRLAVVLGRLDDAVRWFSRGADLAAGIGARPAVVQCRVGLAGALLDRARDDDLGPARVAARQALEEARRLGMPGPEATAAALLARARALAQSRDPLTDREREIADLVAGALTNRQIADRLVLSERTVESHVRSVLAKLGAANRTEIATSRLRGRGTGN